MHMLAYITRLGAMAAGGLILYLAAETTLAHLGQTTGPAANLMRALALGVAVGAVAIGLAWHHDRAFLAIMIAFALVAGEAYGLLSTAERMVAAREATQADARSATAERQAAEARVRAATGALMKANENAAGEAAKRHCARECRKLLEGAITKAGLELVAARAALEQIPAVTASATPLADRLGWPSWAVDLIQATLASLAANGLGASLIAFGAHGGPKPIQPALWGAGCDDKVDIVAGALATVATPPGPRPRDVLQTSFPASEETIAGIDPRWFASDDPEPPGPKGGNRRRNSSHQSLPSNVVPFSRHPVIRALEQVGGSVSSNKELAEIMGVTPPESSKRVREVESLLNITREGRDKRIALKRRA